MTRTKSKELLGSNDGASNVTARQTSGLGKSLSNVTRRFSSKSRLFGSLSGAEDEAHDVRDRWRRYARALREHPILDNGGQEWPP